MKRIKWNLEKAKELYKQHGYTLLEQEYKNTKTPMKILTPDGYLSQINLSNVKIGQGYINFGPNNPYTLENIQKFIRDNGSETQVISTEYIDNTTNLRFQCKCGNEFERTWGNMCKKAFDCPECSKKVQADLQRYTISEVKEIFQEHELILLSDSYRKNNELLEAKTKEGYKVHISVQNLISGKTPQAFSLEFNKENFEYNLNMFILNNHLKCSFIDVAGNDGHGHYILKMKCECGEIFNVPQADFLRLQKFKCNRCTKKISNLEYKTMLWLEEQKIEFVQQKRFDGCKAKRCLPFDFYLPEQNICIEVDGQQHYDKNNIYYDEEIRKHDKIKDNFCNQENIKLLRIPYWYYYNDKYKTFLSNNIQ